MIQLYQTLDLRPIGIPQTLRLSQYDSDFEIIFELTNFDGTWILDTNTTAEVQGTKTDGHGYSADAVFDDQLKTVTIAGDVQMTAAAGRNTFEVVLFHDGDRLGSKNFILDVERAALDAETTQSDSKIKDFTAMTEAAEAAAETATAAAEEAVEAAATFSTDTTLSIAGKAADAAAVGEALEDMDTGLSDDAKRALLACFEHVAWIDDQGQDLYDTLEDALYPNVLVSISAVFNQGQAVIYTDDDLSTLRQYLTVTATYSDQSTSTIVAYTLSGTLVEGTSTITAAYKGKTSTFTVNATARYWDYEWYYTDGMPTDNGMVDYSTDGTAEMTADGLTMTAENASDKSFRYAVPWPDTSSEFNLTVIEWDFVFDSFGNYNNAPYMNGIRFTPGMGLRGGDAYKLKTPAFVFNTSGVTAWHPASGSPYRCESIAQYTWTAGQEYVIRIELTDESYDLYINGVYIVSEQASTFPEAVSSTVFGVSRGASITVKSYKEHKEVTE